MTSILLRSQKKIPKNIADILRQVSDASTALGINSFVIGATARDLIFEYVYGAEIRRKTEDVDFGIAVGSWAEYELLKQSLIGTGNFTDDRSQEQRIWWTGESGEMRVDLVPYGGLESTDGEIRFPPTGDFAMSTVGFREAANDLLILDLDEDLSIKIVSLAGLVLLKFVAYNDRPELRRRDLQDIWFAAANYLLAGNEDRLYDLDSPESDLLNDADFDYRTAGARMLGRDLAPLLNSDTKAIVDRSLGDEADGGRLHIFADIVDRDRLEDDHEGTLAMLRKLRGGIAEGLERTRQLQ